MNMQLHRSCTEGRKRIWESGGEGRKLVQEIAAGRGEGW
jgi:hypothetical protein